MVRKRRLGAFCRLGAKIEMHGGADALGACKRGLLVSEQTVRRESGRDVCARVPLSTCNSAGAGKQPENRGRELKSPAPES
jgi:hypothetical protein